VQLNCPRSIDVDFAALVLRRETFFLHHPTRSDFNGYNYIRKAEDHPVPFTSVRTDPTVIKPESGYHQVAARIKAKIPDTCMYARLKTKTVRKGA
jgi:hypothetical protein